MDVLDEDKLTAAEVAPMLGVKPRTVYALAQAGQLTCFRLGDAVRFTRSMVREYLEKCRSTTTRPESATAMSSTVSLRDSDSELQSYFLKAGAVTKPSPTRKSKTRGSTHLRLAR